jgi:hypothetical protein
MTNHLAYLATVALFALATYAYWLYVTGRVTISDVIAARYSQWVRGFIVGLVVGLVVGALAGHWGWPTTIEVPVSP